MIRNKRQQTEIYILLFMSWTVYAMAQGDMLLPALAVLLTLPSYIILLRFGSKNKTFSFKMPMASIINISVLLGAVWRVFVPPPENAVSFVPIIVPALQSASIIVAVLVWFNFEYKYRAHALILLSWTTVATSVNVPFDPLVQLAFWMFCVTSICMTMLPSYIPYSSKQKDKFKNTRYNKLFLYSYPVFLLIITVLIFVFFVSGVKIGDELFMRLVRDYAHKKNFNFFDSRLLLDGAGNSRNDIRPIMEVEKGEHYSRYLAGQIFYDYRDGLWLASYDPDLDPIPNREEADANAIKISMYENLRGIVPTPRGVVSVEAKSLNYTIDDNGVVFNEDKTIPKANVYFNRNKMFKTIADIDLEKYLEISPFLEKHLLPIINKIIGNSKRPYAVAKLINDFFTNNFGYDLDVNFKADDRGILYMVYEKKDAYCSYFATSMIMMLRAKNIPARMVTGFLASEEAAWSKGILIVRGRDAHAWVEVLLPVMDKSSGMNLKDENGSDLYAWVRFDPTPPDLRIVAIDNDSQINKIADWIWCAQKRFKAFILNIETKTLVNILFMIMGFLIFVEVFKKAIKSYRRKGQLKNGLSVTGDNKRRDSYLKIYINFAEFLKKKYAVSFVATETDSELIARLRNEQNIPVKIVFLIEVFIAKYHAARFGFEEYSDLTNDLNRIVEVSREI